MTDEQLLAKVTQARKRLLLDYPWFGTLALSLAVELDSSLDYDAATNGTVIKFSPTRVEAMDNTALVRLLAHEVAHCALLHPYRRGNRDNEEFNIAADFAINQLLKRAGFELPADWLYDPQFDDMSAEAIYAKRQKDKPQPQNQQQQQPQGQGKQPGGGSGDQQPSNIPASSGRFEDAPASGQPKTDAAAQTTQNGCPPPSMTAEDWKIATEQASRITAKAGRDPGNAARAAKATHEPDADWRGEMQEFIVHQTPSDYSWLNPNRRHIASGLYLPGIHKENLGTVVWVTDSSGSVNDRALNIGWSHFVTLVRECRPERVLYVSCDTVAHVLGEYTSDDIPDTPPTHKGGGGTWFQPPFDLIAKRDEEPPVCLLYYTPDLANSDKPVEPDYPVLWVAPISVRKQAPFGKTVKLDAWAA